jgi:hypothetical protein
MIRQAKKFCERCLLFAKEELEVIHSLSKVSDLVHLPVKSCTLLLLRSDLVVIEHFVSALSDVNLFSDALVVVAFLPLEVVELLSQLGDLGVLDA